MLKRFALCGMVFLGLTGSSSAGGIWVSQERYSDFQVIVSEAASESEHGAARWFQTNWRLLTGYDIPIAAEPLDDRINVWIGRADNPFVTARDLRDLGTEGFIIRTLSEGGGGRGGGKVAQGRHLLLVGGEERGSLYAEWEFFERFLGVRSFAPGVGRWPDAPDSIAAIDFRFVPAFSYRDVSYRTFNPRNSFANAHRLNGHWSRVPERWGGHTRYVGGNRGFGHTFHYFVDPEEYFETHPEYFAEIGGERRQYAQLCLANPDVLAITIDKVRESLREAAPNERIVSVSQMDYFWFDSWCTCANCRAMDEHEGSHSGTILNFVNQVADAIADEFPEVLVDTFAYMYSRKPPKHLKPRDNVVVRLCAAECDYSRPIADRRSPRNRAFAKDLKKWSRISENLFIWDYTQNWHSFQGPHPNVHVLQPNLLFFARHGVDGVFEQASPRSPHSDFEHLKGYLLAKSLWDPGIDWRRLYAEFMDAYYGEAAPYVDAYLDLITAKVKRDDVVLTFGNDMAWMDFGTVERAQAIFAEAFAAVHDEKILERLGYAYLPVQYAALVCPPQVYATGDAYILTRPPSQTLDEYFDMLRSYGVTYLNDWPIEEFYSRLDGETPPRYERLSIEKIRSDALEVWIVPGRGGAIVRVKDTRRDRDLLTGHEDILSLRGRIQEWWASDADSAEGPEPMLVPLEIVAREDDRLVLSGVLEDGLVLQKEVRIAPDGVVLEVVLKLTNVGEEPVELGVVHIADFSTAELGKPQLWFERNGEWERVGAGHHGRVALEARGPESWALRFLKPRLTIRGAAAAEGEGALVSVFVSEDESAGAVVQLPGAGLEPGSSCSLRLRYELTSRKPRGL